MPRLPLALLAFLGAVTLVACGAPEEELHVIEGEPIEYEDTSYNVVISRFLNPADEEDSAYLVGQPEPPEGEQFFGIFLEIESESEEAKTLPETMTVIDTLDQEYEALETESPYALPLGGPLPAGEEYPLANSVASDGPTGGSLVLFLIEESSTENRPLELEVPLSSFETATVELDI